MPRKLKADIQAAVDAARQELANLYNQAHPLVLQAVRDLVHKLLTSLDQRVAADHWAGTQGK